MSLRKRDHRTGESIPAQVAREWPVKDWQDVSIIVAVSGGPDSIALLRGLIELRAAKRDATENDAKGKLEVAHFNHRWRAAASDADEEFVKALCGTLGIRCHVARSESTGQNDQREEMARDERYAYLQETAERSGARYIALGHTADDQAETILHRIIRGTGLRGLAGMPSRRKLSEAVTIVRPMLSVTREQVTEFLTDIDQGYRVDASNKDCQFTRNRIRLDLLPQLARDFNPAVATSLLRLGQLASESVAMNQVQTEKNMAECLVQQNEKKVELDRQKMLLLSNFAQRELLAMVWRQRSWPEQSMGFEQWMRAIESIRSESTTWLPGGVQMMVEDHLVRFTRPDS